MGIRKKHPAFHALCLLKVAEDLTQNMQGKSPILGRQFSEGSSGDGRGCGWLTREFSLGEVWIVSG